MSIMEIDTPRYPTIEGVTFVANKKPRLSNMEAFTKTLADQAGYVQRTQKRKQSGKKMNRGALAAKILRSSIQTYVTRFQYLGAANELPFTLTYEQAPAPSGENKYPLYLFDLTGLPQRRFPATDYWEYPAVGYRLLRDRQDVSATDSNNRYKFGTVAGIHASGSGTATTWQCERRPERPRPIANGHLDWVDIRLGVRGPKAKPCNVHIALVQFDEFFTPPAWGFSNNTGSIADALSQIETKDTAADTSKRWNEFWLGLVDRHISHPLNKRDAINVKGMKVLDWETLRFNPTSTFETDTFGHKQELKWFKNMNRKCNYQWEHTMNTVANTGTGIAVPPGDEDDPNRWDTTNPGFSTLSTEDSVQAFVHPNARVFLMVLSEVPTTGAYNADTNASFELLIRRRHSMIANG